MSWCICFMTQGFGRPSLTNSFLPLIITFRKADGSLDWGGAAPPGGFCGCLQFLSPSCALRAHEWVGTFLLRQHGAPICHHLCLRSQLHWIPTPPALHLEWGLLLSSALLCASSLLESENKEQFAAFSPSIGQWTDKCTILENLGQVPHP